MSTFSNDRSRRVQNTIRILAGFELILIAVTWPLWGGHSSFPSIPFYSGLSLPPIADCIGVWLLLATCIYTVVSSGQRPRATIIRGVALAAAMILCISSQQRLQAWHWLFVMGLSTLLLNPEYGLSLMRSTLASIYVCSALSRMAPMAHQGMSAAIVDQLLLMTGIGEYFASGNTREVVCQLFNAGELVIGLLLIWPPSRRSGMLFAITLHVTLLLALGPLGLKHQWAVSIWNVCLLCLIPVVFACPMDDGLAIYKNRHWSYQAALTFVWLFPLSGLFGIADNWPAWQVYSTRPESWTLRIKETDRHYIDEYLRPHVSAPAPLDEWVVVRLDRWSLEETGSPLYPKGRFQCELIRRVLNSLPAEAEFRVDISEPQHWFWWKRTHRTLTNRAELQSGQVVPCIRNLSDENDHHFLVNR